MDSLDKIFQQGVAHGRILERDEKPSEECKHDTFYQHKQSGLFVCVDCNKTESYMLYKNWKLVDKPSEEATDKIYDNPKRPTACQNTDTQPTDKDDWIEKAYKDRYALDACDEDSISNGLYNFKQAILANLPHRSLEKALKIKKTSKYLFINCPSCGISIRTDWMFCPECGEIQRVD